MNIEKRIRAIAAKKVKVIITSKTRNRDGFAVTGPDGLTKHRTKREAIQAMLARVRCSNQVEWAVRPLLITPNPKHKADVPWKRKVL